MSEQTNDQAILISDNRPDFISEVSIGAHAERITQEFTPHLVKGIEFFAAERALDLAGLETDEPLRAWVWAARATRYNAAYFVSRHDSATDRDYIESNARAIDEAGQILDDLDAANRIINYAFHSFIQGFAAQPGREVRVEGKSIPPNAIQAQDASTLVIRYPKSLETDPAVSFAETEQIYDWHDLAHMTAAASSNGAFGVKYHSGLGALDRYYRAITEGEGMQDASGPLFSDGLLFSQLSKPILERYEEQQTDDGSPKYSYDEIREFIAQELFKYLGGEYPLWHPGISAELQADRPINPVELAVCIQNKRYERRASEVEPFVLVRGTPNGARGNPDRDPLYDMERSERVKHVDDTDNELFYFEARNVTRHRAHEDALGRFAAHLLQQRKADLEKASSSLEQQYTVEDIQLLEASLEFFKLDDLRQGRESNLYELVGDILAARKERNAEAA